MPRENEQQFLSRILKDHADAIQFVNIVARAAQLLDDLIDKDRERTDAEIIQVFWELIVEMPANPFYRSAEPYLRPILAQIIQDWQDSVKLERTGIREYQRLSFVLRDQLASLIIQCAYLIGGRAWAVEVGTLVRLHCHEDTFEDYVNSLEAE